MLPPSANVCTIFVLRFFAPTKTGRVHAFEPNPQSRLLLSSAVALNGMHHRIAVHGIALGEHGEDGKVLIGDTSELCDQSGNCKKHDEGFNSGAFSLAGMRAVEDDGTPLNLSDGQHGLVAVTVRSLDSYAASGFLNGKRCPRLIKFDLEGMDIQGLKGAARTIARCSPYIIFEIMKPRKTYRDVDELLVRRTLLRDGWMGGWISVNPVTNFPNA